MRSGPKICHDRVSPTRHRRRQGTDGPRQPADRDLRQRKGNQGPAGVKSLSFSLAGSKPAPVAPRIRLQSCTGRRDAYPTRHSDDSCYLAPGRRGPRRRPANQHAGPLRHPARAPKPLHRRAAPAWRPSRNAVLHARLHGQKDRSRQRGHAQSDDRRRPDCQLGIHAIRLRSLGGVSNLRTFTVGNLPEVKETEPNNDPEQAQPIPLNVTVSGVVQAEDIDHFVVELKQGDRLNVGARRIAAGNTTFFDPVLSILDGRWQNMAKATMRPFSAGLSLLAHCSARTASTSFSFAKWLSAATPLHAIACTSASFRGRRLSSARQASQAKRSRFIGSAMPLGLLSNRSRCLRVASQKPSIVAQRSARHRHPHPTSSA